MKNFPSFTIDVFQTIEKYNRNLVLIEKGITILSLFPVLGSLFSPHSDWLVFEDVIQKVKKLTDYLLAAMSSHNLSLIANIIVVLAKMQLDEPSYQYLDSHSFLSVIFEFVNEFADKPLPDSTTNLPHLYYRPFADIVFYTLVYIKQHFQSNRTIFSLALIAQSSCPRSMFAVCSSGSIASRATSRSSRSGSKPCRTTSDPVCFPVSPIHGVDFGTMTEALEVKTVNMLLDLFVVYNDSSIASLHIEFNILNILLNFFFRYTSISSQIIRIVL